MECYVNDLYSNACIASRIQLLFALLIRRFGKQISFYDTKRNADDRADFAQILWYIQKNYTTVTLQSLAETFHYNPSYLSSLIKKNTGRTLFDILSDLKMNEAAELLRHTNMKISQISDILGYDSVDYFSRLFKKTYGVPPKQYALQNH